MGNYLPNVTGVIYDVQCSAVQIAACSAVQCTTVASEEMRYF